MKGFAWAVNRGTIEIYNRRGKKLATIAKDHLDTEQQTILANLFCASGHMRDALKECREEFIRFGLEFDDLAIRKVNRALLFTKYKSWNKRVSPIKKAA